MSKHKDGKSGGIVGDHRMPTEIFTFKIMGI